MFDEEEPKKEKPIDLDDLSVEEIEKMTKGDLKKLRAQGKIKSIAYPFY